MKLKLLLCATAVLVQGAFQPLLAAEKTGVRVADSFEVGDNVYVRALTVEKASNTLWVGTSVGAHEIDLKTSKPRNTFTRQQGLANEYVFAVGVDSEGYKWFGTNAGGASRFKDGQWKTFFPMHGLADYWIYCFTSQKDGTLWIGGSGGLDRFDERSGRIERRLDRVEA